MTNPNSNPKATNGKRRLLADKDWLQIGEKALLKIGAGFGLTCFVIYIAIPTIVGWVTPATPKDKPAQVQVVTASTNTNTNTSAGGDPYAAYTSQQVMDTFIKAYQAHDWATCEALIAPSVKVGWSTPDQFERQVAQVEREQGNQLTIKTYGAIQGANNGTEQQYLVLYTRSKGTGSGAGAGTNSSSSMNAQSDATITLRAINGTYKVSAYTIF